MEKDISLRFPAGVLRIQPPTLRTMSSLAVRVEPLRNPPARSAPGAAQQEGVPEVLLVTRRPLCSLSGLAAGSQEPPRQPPERW